MADSDRRPTIVDVAQRAHVSVATVSYVLNDKPGVGDRSRQRVLSAALELGFRPNRLARGLRKGQSGVLGLMLANISNPFYPEIAAGIIAAASEAGYQVFLSQTGDDGMIMQREVQAMREHQSDGFIFTSTVAADRPFLEALLAERVPFVQLIRRIPGLRADFVGADAEAGGEVLVDHLIRLGHRDIGVVAGPQRSSESRGRLVGVKRRMRQAGLDLPRDRLVEAALTHESGYDGALALLGRRARPPSALLCGSDQIALGAIDALIDMRLQIPEDMAVVGYDDMSIAGSRLVQLTTIHQPRAEMGVAAVRLLVERLQRPDLPPRTVILPHRLVVRRSSGAPPETWEPPARRSGSE